MFSRGDTSHAYLQPGDKLLYADEVSQIQGAVYEVNREMGAGFLEAAYQECLALEFEERKIPFVAPPTLSLKYKDRRLQRSYVP